MKRLVLLLMACLLLSMGVVEADSAAYTILVDDSGEALVLITMSGTGLHTLELPEDVDDVRVKGALYLIENGTLELSIGSAEEAAVLYKTALLTEKRVGWQVGMGLLESADSSVTLHLPPDVVVEETDPRAFVEDGDYTTISWAGPLSAFSVSYAFPVADDPLPPIQDTPIILPDPESEPDSKTDSFFTPLVVAMVLISAIIIVTLGIILWRRQNSAENKRNVLKTLPKNEGAIIKALSAAGGGLRRNELERKSGIAKSSLASSLHNLEKKSIVEIDRTHTTHYVSLTEWYKQL
ncbi:MAG: hypothetical protein ABIC95_01410 [archaeon]